jgi:hypothetical protein
MRPRVKLTVCLLASIAGAFFIFSTGCTKPETCNDATSCGKTYKACCTATDCHYVYNGKSYPCNGTDCSAAAQQLVADMCGSAKSSAQAEAVVKDVLQKMRCANTGTNP